MRGSFVIGLVCVLALLFSWQAQPSLAGFVDIDVTPVGDPPAHGPPTVAWGHIPESSNAWMVLDELFGAPANVPYELLVSGITDVDPILTITKNITNTTAFAWSGYNIDLDPLDTDTFVGTPTSDKMTLLSQTAYSLDFGLPVAVQPGQSVQFVFDVNVPDVGPFNFTLSQSPILVPEPASLALVGLAALLLGGWYRRKVV